MESYKSRVDYTVSDNTKVTYSFPFQYLKKKFVKVDVTITDNTVATLTYGVDYTVTDLSITLTAALEVGKTLTIYRETDTDSIVSWNDGSILLAADMSLSDVQMLHLQEEQEDYLKTHSIRTETTAYNETVFDASSQRIHNVADPIDAQDAVTKNYMESVQSGFVQQNTALKNETTKQASDATVSATNAKTSETNSKTSETNAATSAAAAKVSETNAKTSETNAKTSETNAKASETNAKTSEIKAATSEHNAKVSETNAKTSETKASASAEEAVASAEVVGGFLDYTATAKTADIITKGPWADVRAFGAKGDGVTDDTAAIQAAMDYSNSVCPVFFPSGNYLVASTLIIKYSNYTIFGMDNGVSSYATTAHLTKITCTAQILFSAEVTTSLTTVAMNLSGIYFIHSHNNETSIFFNCLNLSNSHIYNNTILNFGTIIKGTLTQISLFEHNDIEGIGTNFMSWAFVNTEATLVDSKIINNYLNGEASRNITLFQTGSIATSVVSHNYIDFCKFLITIHDAGSITFSENIFDFLYSINGGVLNGCTFANNSFIHFNKTLALPYFTAADSEMTTNSWAVFNNHAIKSCTIANNNVVSCDYFYYINGEYNNFDLTIQGNNVSASKYYLKYYISGVAGDGLRIKIDDLNYQRLSSLPIAYSVGYLYYPIGTIISVDDIYYVLAGATPSVAQWVCLGGNALTSVSSTPSFTGQIAIADGVVYIATGTDSVANWVSSAKLDINGNTLRGDSVTVLTASATILPTQLGQFFISTALSAITVTLPAMAAGAKLTLKNLSAYDLTISYGSAVIVPLDGLLAGVISSVVVPSGKAVSLQSSSTYWYVIN